MFQLDNCSLSHPDVGQIPRVPNPDAKKIREPRGLKK